MNNLPPSVAIRNACISDWPRLRHAVRAIFDHLGDAEVSHLLRRHHAGTVVACHGREIAGYYQFYPHVEPRVAWLNFFGVTPRWRGQGTADILLTYFERHAKACGFESLALDALEDNVRAHRFYLRAGFERQATQTFDDGVKVRFVKTLTGVTALDRAVPSLEAPGALVRALRKLAYGALLLWPRRLSWWPSGVVSDQGHPGEQA